MKLRHPVYAARPVPFPSLVGLCAALLGGCGSPPSSTSAPGKIEGLAAPTGSAPPGGPSSKRPPRRLPAGQARPPAVALGTRGAVASQEAHATDVGRAILERGGNAVDAAVAVGLALAVTHPSAGNLGGGGFMVVRLADGTAHALDFRETAPSKAHRDMYLDKDGKPTKESLQGPKAAGIPGSVAGLAEAHRKLGRLGWKDVVAPAERLAREGHVVDEIHAKDIASGVTKMKEAGFEATAKLYARPDGAPLAAGDTWKQPELAATLAAIKDGGPAAFYEGPLAERMVAEVTRAGGVWEPKDLAAYRAKWREPIRFDYRGHEVTTMPPPSAGGIVLRQVLAASEAMHMERAPWRSADEIHLFVEAARRTYADRNQLLGDPDFVKMPIASLLDPAYTARRVADVDPAKATPSTSIREGLPAGRESEQTTHYSVVDEEGTAVSTTTTLNTGYGARFAATSVGVLLNNEMDDFAVKPGSPNVFGLVQGEQNKIEPGKRMLSSMTPTILAKDGDLRAVLGSPGGPTISTTVAQLTRALVDYGKPLDEAVGAFRVHHQWLPDAIWAEAAIPPEVEAVLVARGHAIKKRPGIGHANCIEVDPTTRGFRAVADVARGGGKAAAY